MLTKKKLMHIKNFMPFFIKMSWKEISIRTLHIQKISSYKIILTTKIRNKITECFDKQPDKEWKSATGNAFSQQAFVNSWYTLLSRCQWWNTYNIQSNKINICICIYICTIRPYIYIKNWKTTDVKPRGHTKFTDTKIMKYNFKIVQPYKLNVRVLFSGKRHRDCNNISLQKMETSNVEETSIAHIFMQHLWSITPLNNKSRLSTSI